MVKKSLFLALYAGLTVYLILNLFWGTQGVNALAALRAERAVLEENMDILTGENRDVQIHLDQLKNDRQSITLQARKLGYIREGEKIIYTDLGSPAQSISYGLPIIRTGTDYVVGDRSAFFRVLALVVGLSMFLLVLILEWGEKGIRRVPPSGADQR